ncbi:ethylbenzene dehydrogenase-related protein [Desulfobacterales bacterium HSG17]|nr:ethylbenzene dehydrogenase-related protein [Desulfobacterales bacterium HSG17]
MNRFIKKSILNYSRFIIPGILMILIFSGCSSSSGNGDNNTDVSQAVISQPVLQGVLVDSPVQGVNFETTTQSGITDSDGRFMYQEGETVAFSIGETVLGRAKGQEIITPVHLIEGAVDEKHPAVTNMARFMQSLDADGNPENGISISYQVRNEMAGRHIDFHLDMTDFETHPDVKAVFDNLNANNAFHDGNHGLVTSEQARKHLKEHMNPGSIDTDDISKDTDTDDVSKETETDDNKDDVDSDDVSKDDVSKNTDKDTDDISQDSDSDDVSKETETDDNKDDVNSDDVSKDTDTDDMQPQKINTGRFVDSPVEGLRYGTATQSGITDAEGRFTYLDGETIDFSIGDLMLGRGPAQEIMTPVHLVDGAIDETHPAVTNMARFMQSLDADGNLENGITIPPQASTVLLGRHIRFDYSVEDFENNHEVRSFFERMNELGAYPHGGTMLYSPEQARQHMSEHMNFIRDDDTATDNMPGWANDMMNGNNGMMPGWSSEIASTLFSNRINSEQDISSIDENFWSQVQGINVSVMPMMTPELWGKFNTVELKSVHTDSTLYVYARWKDDSPNVSKKMWQKTQEGWQQSDEDEDRLGIAWDMNGELTSPNGSIAGMGMSMMQGGCAVLCHVNPSEPSKLTMTTSRVGGIVDLWHWKSSRTNPAGYSDDQYFDDEDHKNDSGSGAYADNIAEDGLIPSHMFTGSSNNSNVLFENESAIFDDSMFASGDKLSAFLMKTPAGDRADIQAKGVWAEGYWTVVLKRSMNTGSDTDVQFSLNGSHPFAISIFDNAGDEKHLKSYLLNLNMQ